MNKTEWIESLKPNDNVVLALDNGALYLRTVDYRTNDTIFINGFDEGFINGVCRVGIDEKGHNAYFRIYEYSGTMKVRLRHTIRSLKLKQHTWDDEDKMDKVYELVFGDEE